MYIKWLAWLLAGLMILPSVAPASVTESPGTDIAIEETQEAETQETVPETEALPPIEETQTGSEVPAAEEPEVPAGQDAKEALLEILHEDEIHDILTSDEEYYATLENFRLRSARTSAGSFYQQLTAQEAVFYEQLEEGDLLACAKEDTSFVFMQGTDMVVEIAYQDMNTYLGSEEYRTKRASGMSMIARAFDAYLKDNPEEFWMRGFSIGSQLSYNPNRPVDEIQTITIRLFLKFTNSLYYEGILDDIEAVQSALQTAEDTIREQLNGQTDRYVIASKIHEYITDLMSYPLDYSPGYGYWHTISGPLLEKYNHQGVCEGYAKLFKYFCDQFDVPCMIVIGSSSSGGEVDHMWNYAQMEDGAWYLVDVTWDDGSTPRWTYFMKKKQTSSHVPYGVFSGGISYSAFTYPTLSATDYTYIPTSALQGITLDKSTLSLQEGKTESLTVSYQPSQPSDVSAAWISSDDSVATVNSSGNVTAVSEGTAVITASAGGFSATCTVTVEPRLQGITLNKSTLSLQAGKTESLVVSYQPSQPSGVSVTWTSSNNSVATVNSSGTVTAVKAGTAVITVSVDGFSAACTVTVPLQGITLDKSTLSLQEGKTESLTVSYQPSQPSDVSAAWTSSDDSVATVNSSGNVTAVSEGTAVITASAGGFSAACTVTVEPRLRGITLNKSTLSLQAGKTESLEVSYQPSQPSGVSVNWTSSNNSVATVNSSGTVTAVKAGTAVITVSVDGFSATCTVTVPLQGITLNKSTLSLNRGSTGSLTVSYQPSPPSGVSASWTSSNSSVATVNSSGVVTAVGEGTAVITASAGGFKATCTVTVTLTSRMMIEDFVTRLYKLVLGRTPDAGGLTYWADQLASKKKTGMEVAYGFFFSDEYINKKVSDSTFAETLYRTLLDRNSDASGKAYWLNCLSTGVTRYYIFAGFANSTEFADICNKYQITRGSYQSTAIADQNVKVTAFVSRMYTVCLGRGFDRVGLDDWVGRLLRGETTGKGIIYGFFFSTEFKSKNTSNETFVTLAYKTLFDRNPDTAGYNDWLARLRGGQSREAILNGFIGSAEFTRLCENYGIRKE